MRSLALKTYSKNVERSLDKKSKKFLKLYEIIISRLIREKISKRSYYCRRIQLYRGKWKPIGIFIYQGSYFLISIRPCPDCVINLFETQFKILLIFFCRFYFPGGKPIPLSQLETIILNITTAFQNLPNCRASRAQFCTITKVEFFLLYYKKRYLHKLLYQQWIDNISYVSTF